MAETGEHESKTPVAGEIAPLPASFSLPGAPSGLNPAPVSPLPPPPFDFAAPLPERVAPPIAPPPPGVAPRKEKSNLTARVITALIGIPFVMWLVWRAEAATFNLAVALLAILGLRELGGALRAAKLPFVRGLAFPALLVLLLAQPLVASGSRFAGLIVWLMPFFLLIGLLIHGVLRYPSAQRVSLQALALTLCATLYCGLFVFFILLRALEGSLFASKYPLGVALLWLTLIGVWSGDTVAYFAGRALGKEKLTPLSPGKTWEGAVAGLVATIAVSVPVAKLMEIELRHGLALGILIALAAPLGDLAESFWKRELQIKDMGGALPGHGGILDRCDSLLFSVFVVYVYAQILMM